MSETSISPDISFGRSVSRKAERRPFSHLLVWITSYDFIIIDTNCATSPLLINALTAADSVLIPITPEFYAIEGLTDLISTVLKNKRRLNPAIEFEGIVFTISDVRTNLYKTARADVDAAFSDDIYIFDTVIPRTVQVGEAIKRGLTVIQYDKTSPASYAYQELAREVIVNASFQGTASSPTAHNARIECTS